MANPTIYFISNTFPPLGRGGAIVRGQFAKHLAEDGWNIKVITQGKRKGFFLKWQYDYKFFDKIKSKLNIEQINSWQWGILGEVFSTLKVVPSMHMPWIHKTIKSLNTLIDQNTEGIVFANYPDIANFHVALAIKQKYNFPLILDFRDDYFAHQIKPFIDSADIIFTTTDMIKNKIIKNFDFDEEHIHTILNGYSHPVDVPSQRPPKDKFKIIYAGTIAQHQKPEILNLAYKKLLEQHPDLQDKIEIEVFGQESYYYHWYYKKTLRKGINFNGFASHEDILKIMTQDIDLGFFSLADEKYAYATPTKLFDYINAELPILAAVPDGECKNIIKQNNFGKVFHFNDIDGLAGGIYDFYQHQALIEKIRTHMRKVKDQYDIQLQVKKMSEVLKRNYTQ